jgi:ABC-type lipoprotein export system ATPase subunit
VVVGEERKSTAVSAIEVRDLTKKYRSGSAHVAQALDRVTLRVEPGELVAVAGRSGSGKTTLLHAMGLLVRPTAGQVLIDGVDTGALTDARRTALRGRRIGFVLPRRNLLPNLTVLENVMLPQRYAWLDRSAGSRARDLLDLVGLGDHLKLTPDQLSAGQLQRVAIARAMVRQPGVVLADEPTGELDSRTSGELLQLVQEINRMSGVTFIVATHDADVASCADRVVHLVDGAVAADERSRMGLDRLRGIR